MTWLSLRSIIVYIQELFFLVAVAIYYIPFSQGQVKIDWSMHQTKGSVTAPALFSR